MPPALRGEGGPCGSRAELAQQPLLAKPSGFCEEMLANRHMLLSFAYDHHALLNCVGSRTDWCFMAERPTFVLSNLFLLGSAVSRPRFTWQWLSPGSNSGQCYDS